MKKGSKPPQSYLLSTHNGTCVTPRYPCGEWFRQREYSLPLERIWARIRLNVASIASSATRIAAAECGFARPRLKRITPSAGARAVYIDFFAKSVA